MGLDAPRWRMPVTIDLWDPDSRHCLNSNQSADHRELPLLCSSLDYPLCSPVVDPRCFGGSVDRRAITVCFQHRDHRLGGLCSHTGCDHDNRAGRFVRAGRGSGERDPLATPKTIRCTVRSSGRRRPCSRRWLALMRSSPARSKHTARPPNLVTMVHGIVWPGVTNPPRGKG